MCVCIPPWTFALRGGSVHLHVIIDYGPWCSVCGTVSRPSVEWRVNALSCYMLSLSVMYWLLLRSVLLPSAACWRGGSVHPNVIIVYDVLSVVLTPPPFRPPLAGCMLMGRVSAPSCYHCLWCTRRSTDSRAGTPSSWAAVAAGRCDRNARASKLQTCNVSRSTEVIN